MIFHQIFVNFDEIFVKILIFEELGLRVYNFKIRVYGLKIENWGLGFEDPNLGFRV